MQLAFYFDQTRCTGCYTCVVACKDWHDIPAGPVSWRKVETFEKGRYPDVFVAFLSTSCHHCAAPACMDVCPANAITKRQEDGIVVVNREDCLGRDSCGMCFEACLFNAPQFGAEENAQMQKCDLCADRWTENKLPICVAACPMRALDAGPIDEMWTKYGQGIEAVGFSYDKQMRPSVVFKPKVERTTPSHQNV
ncbi:MAG: 4Fe-4S dicluster domain-containing protein [Dehalococcoidia bacterium]|nr:4Fe-4S dicluster domain-containing protein [Dehalococcoidia bacterium]